jgi:hypothetical protein
MSSESRPKLGKAVAHFELFMTAWEKKAEQIPRLKPFIDVGLRWATKYYKRMDNTKAYVIAMCKFTCEFTIDKLLMLRFCTVVDPSVRLDWVKRYWDKIWIEDAEETIIKLVGYFI